MWKYWGGRECWLSRREDGKWTLIEQSVEIGIGGRNYSLIQLEGFIGLPCLIYAPCSLKPCSRVSIFRIFYRQGGDLALDSGTEAPSEFNNNGVRVCVSGLTECVYCEFHVIQRRAIPWLCWGWTVPPRVAWRILDNVQRERFKGRVILGHYERIQTEGAYIGSSTASVCVTRLLPSIMISNFNVECFIITIIFSTIHKFFDSDVNFWHRCLLKEFPVTNLYDIDEGRDVTKQHR